MGVQVLSSADRIFSRVMHTRVCSNVHSAQLLHFKKDRTLPTAPGVNPASINAFVSKTLSALGDMIHELTCHEVEIE